MSEIVDMCGVCSDPVTERDEAWCDDCRCTFHWMSCGGWGPDGHACHNCVEPEDDEP